MTTENPTIRADIARVLCDATDAMARVQYGLTAVLSVASDNDSEFANTAHWMVSRIDEDFAHAAGLIEAAHEAMRIENQTGIRSDVADSLKTVERLRKFVADNEDGEKRFPYAVAQEAIDGAVADAVFVLAQTQRWGQFQPIMQGLQRAGMAPTDTPARSGT